MNKIKVFLKKIMSHLIPTFSTLLRVMVVISFILAYILIGFFFGTQKCEAKTIYYGSETEAVTLSYGGPTIFRFNDPVKTISQASKFKIEPADMKNPNYSVLSITPLFTRGKTKVSFILSNGVVVHTKMVIVSKSLPEKTDSFYDFLPKENLIEKPPQGSHVSDLELMKAMIRRDNVVGYKIRNLVRTVRTGIEDLRAKLVRVYTGPKYNGYIFKIQNHSSKEYAIDLESLTLGNPNVALLSQVDHKRLESKKKKDHTTYLRIVSKPTSVYYSVSLPVSPVRD